MGRLYLVKARSPSRLSCGPSANSMHSASSAAHGRVFRHAVTTPTTASASGTHARPMALSMVQGSLWAASRSIAGAPNRRLKPDGKMN